MQDDPRDRDLDPDTHCPGHGTAYDRNGICPDCQWWQERQAQGAIWEARHQQILDEELGAALAARFDKDADQ